jgi:hypothetical protein
MICFEENFQDRGAFLFAFGVVFGAVHGKVKWCDVTWFGCPWLVPLTVGRSPHGLSNDHRDGVSSSHIHVVLEVGRESKGVLYGMDPVSCFTTGKSGLSQAEADGRDKLGLLTCSKPVTLKEREEPLPANFSSIGVMRGENGRVSLGIHSMNMLRYSMYLLILLLIWIPPILVSPGAGFGW